MERLGREGERWVWNGRDNYCELTRVSELRESCVYYSEELHEADNLIFLVIFECMHKYRVRFSSNLLS